MHRRPQPWGAGGDVECAALQTRARCDMRDIRVHLDGARVRVRSGGEQSTAESLVLVGERLRLGIHTLPSGAEAEATLPQHTLVGITADDDAARWPELWQRERWQLYERLEVKLNLRLVLQG